MSAAFRPYIRAINFGLIAAMAYLLADISNFFVASYIDASMAVPKNAQRLLNRNPKQGPIVPHAADYQSIVRQNIFDPTMGIFVPAAPVMLTPRPSVIPPPVISPPVIAPKVPLNVRLIGTVVQADSPSYAVIQDNRTRKQLIYRVGDFLLEDAKITKIDRNRVVIAREQEEVVFEVSLSGAQSRSNSIFPPGTRYLPQSRPVAIPPLPPSRDTGIRQVSESRYVMDRREIDYAVAHLPELMTKARVVPNFTNGKADGFRIFAIQEDSIYAKIGLKNGDVLKRVNQIDVRNPQNFLQVFESLKEENNITINLVRDTKEKTFDYIIRQ